MTSSEYHRGDKAQFEVQALRSADLGDQAPGFSFLNDSKYAYDAAGRVRCSEHGL
jgi:alpha-mannosidase